MRQSLRFKLTAAFLVLTVAVFVLISIFANIILKNQFQQYTIAKQEQAIANVVLAVQQKYNGFNGTWDVAGVESAGMNALDQGLIVRVSDSSGDVIWDARTHNNGMCTSIIMHMSQNMQSYNANFQGGYVETDHPLTVGGVQAGTVYVGYYGPYFFSDSDLQFLNSLNSLLLWAAVIASAACLALGAYMARRLTTPIARVIHTAGHIADGNYTERAEQKTNTKEIIELTDSINSLAEKLQKQEALRKRLTGDVAHELRTPLATLQSHVEAMIDGVWEPDQERLKSFHEEIMRLSAMVGDLEKLSIYDGENLEISREKFDLAILAKAVLKNFEAEFKNKGIQSSIMGGEEIVFADRDKISQALINLIANALKYTPAGGSVAVEVSGNETGSFVTVEDNGPGISQEDLPYIFERFYRTDRSRNSKTGGRGIGLTIAKAIAEAHGGWIDARSEINKGSAFTLTLPK